MAEDPPRVPGYRLTREIGRGTYGTVWVGRQDATGRAVAVKVLGRVDRRSRSRFAREARILGRLAGHPHVVEVIGFGHLRRGRRWLAMEHLPGTLADEIGRATPQRVTEVGIQLAGALAATHQIGLLHRDVKPHNVLVDAGGPVKLADFGIALAGEAGRLPGGAEDSALGALDFAAPEVRSGRTPSSHHSDQYGLCATLAALLVRRVPEAGTRSAGGPGPADPASGLATADAPRDLIEVIGIGLRPDPGERHPSIDALALGLRQVQDAHGWGPTPYRAGLAEPSPPVAPTTAAASDRAQGRLVAAATEPSPMGFGDGDRRPSWWRRLARLGGGRRPADVLLPWETSAPARRRGGPYRVALAAALPVVILGTVVYQVAGRGDDDAGGTATPGDSLPDAQQVIAVSPPPVGVLSDVSGLEGEDCMHQAPALGPVTLTLRDRTTVSSLRLILVSAVPEGTTIDVKLGDAPVETVVLAPAVNYEPQSVRVGPVETETVTFVHDVLTICHVIVNG